MTERSKISLYRALRKSCQSFTSQAGESGLTCLCGSFYFDNNFPGFQGHFPDHPVLPAVVQLAAVRCVAEMSLKQKLVPSGYDRIKFRGIVEPGGPTEVRVELSQDGDGWSAGFLIENCKGESVADGTCRFVLTAKR
jgi:3-hydroxyacyl-[acyl-carrier-protein] dehydratase